VGIICNRKDEEIKMIDEFTKDEFEQALNGMFPQYTPKNLGFIDGEYCFLLQITHNVGIYIRSSIGRDGYSATVGEDSIRVLLVQYEKLPTILQKEIYRTEYLGKAGGRWTTRIKGWQSRLKKVIQEMIDWINIAQYCPHCEDQPLHFFKVKKEGQNKGRIFATCPNKAHKKVFIWIT